jgi:hypothetical protein
MDKYTEHFKKQITPQRNQRTNLNEVDMFADAQGALAKAAFANHERNEFFDMVYCDVLKDIFDAWLKSPAHCTKEREFLYTTAMALGEVKRKMTQYETLASNAAFINQTKVEKESDEIN